MTQPQEPGALDRAAARARIIFIELKPDSTWTPDTIPPWSLVSGDGKKLWRLVAMGALEAARNVPFGLCAIRGDHAPHDVMDAPLAPFICTGREGDREPGRSERRRAEQHAAYPPLPQVPGLTVPDLPEGWEFTPVKRPARLRYDLSNGVQLLVCEGCGSFVAPERQQTHTAWHARVDQSSTEV